MERKRKRERERERKRERERETKRRGGEEGARLLKKMSQLTC